jgi:hypothetical protein
LLSLHPAFTILHPVGIVMLNALPQPLLADIGEVIGGLVALVGLVLWIVQKIAEANKEAAASRPARPQPPVAAAAGQGGARPAGQQADPLRNQVEEFLRRAGRGPQAGQQGGPRQRPPGGREIEVLIDDRGPAPERRNVATPRPLEANPGAAAAAATPIVVPPNDKRGARRSVVPRKRKSLAERATERAAARSQSIATQVSHLGQRIIEDDQQFDVQLKAKFDHSLGTLAEKPVVTSEPPPVSSDSPAAQIAALLASPDGVRQAIVLNEILRRPSDRW